MTELEFLFEAKCANKKKHLPFICDLQIIRMWWIDSDQNILYQIIKRTDQFFGIFHFYAYRIFPIYDDEMRENKKTTKIELRFWSILFDNKQQQQQPIQQLIVEIVYEKKTFTTQSLSIFISQEDWKTTS